MKYKCILIDDEEKVRRVLKMKLEQYCPDLEIIAEAETAQEGYEAISSLKPDLIFLDISMPGESGFDLLERFDEVNFDIIFVTGYNEYALEALKLSAVDYLLKPVKTESLIQACEKAKVKIEEKQIVEKYALLKHNLANVGNDETKIVIPGSDYYSFIKVKDIIRCEGWQKYTRLYITNGDVAVSSYNIGKFKELLDNYGFINTHKSHLINKTHVKYYKKEGFVVLSDGSEVPLARRRKDAFMKQIIDIIVR